MMMKYFRFLYGETNACLIHFGEVKDTKSHEAITVLFFRGCEDQSEQGEQKSQKELNGKRPFLIPDSIDLAVMGNITEAVKREWKELGQHVHVRTLLIPDVPEAEELYWENVEEVIRLHPICQKDGVLQECSNGDQWGTVKAGWSFEVRCWNKGTLTLWHDLAEDSSEMLSAEQTEIREFIDCVMSVKATDNSICCENRNPDEYGCAMGCVLHRDYDVCKFRYENRANPYLTGTLLTAGTGNEIERVEFLDWLSARADRIRFCSMQNLDGWMNTLAEHVQPTQGMRRYYIGMNGEISDHAATEFCRKGFGSAPMILSEGKGMCCSSLLSYGRN